MAPLIKLAVGIAGTALIASMAYRLVRSPLLSDLGSRAAVVMAANGITDGRANWVTDNGWTWRVARLSGTADAPTRQRTLAAVAALTGVNDAEWQEEDGADPVIAAPSHLDLAACQSRLDAITAADRVRFEPSNASLEPSSRRLLDAIAQTLQTCPGARVLVTDETASGGTAAIDLALSKARAAVLGKALADRGIPAALVLAKGTGSANTEPLDAGAVPSHRVTFRLAGQETTR